jgi:hypothetical protein
MVPWPSFVSTHSQISSLSSHAPLWPEIRDALLSDQTAQDRLDLVARVFKLKLAALLKDITDSEIIGKEKRGLPHAHILLILNQGFKPRMSEIVDSIIQAEIPNRETRPLLYETVVRCMSCFVDPTVVDIPIHHA